MKKIIASIIVGLGLLVGTGSVMTLATAPVADAQLSTGANKTRNAVGNRSVDGLVSMVVNVLLYVVGAVAVIMIIVGGIMYVVSSGDAGKAKTAKNTILYAVVGVVVAAFSWAIVNFVLNRI